MKPRPNYRDREVRALVEEYEELQGLKGTWNQGLRNMISLLDIQRGMRKLTQKEREAVFLCGLANLTQGAAAALLGISQPTMYRRYTFAIEKLTNYLNGVQ